jgi:apolipoprotein N-acyltransferase
MFHLVDGAGGERPLRQAALRGWLAGVGYFFVSLFWIAEPFQVDAREQGWMAPFADPAVSMFLALFWGAAAIAYRALAGRGALRALLFAGSLALAEWLRGHVLSGFPWDLPGESWPAGRSMSQAASLVGAYGLTWLTLAGVCLLTVSAEGRAGRLGAIFAVVGALFLCGWGWGAARIAQAPAPRTPSLRVRIVQADVKQETKYDAASFAGIVERYVSLTRRPPAAPLDVVVWPEGAIPAAFEDYLAPGAWPRDAIAGALGPSETLILGGYRLVETPGGSEIAFNSAIALRLAGGEPLVEAVYDKYRLVPFGEFMPLDPLMSRLGVKQLVHVGDGFSPGPRPRPLRLAGLPPAQILICYEALFPGFTREGTRMSGLRPSWIVNISNDAWFGTGSGPLQHLNMARYRAIEEGLPMARATPTGVSAMIDAFGRIKPAERLEEGAFGVIDAPLPPALKPTIYDTVGDLAFFAMLAISLVGARRPRLPGARA